MKGIILAAGAATRLFPLTATTSKQLLPVYDRQMIFYPLNVLVKGGIKDILIIIAPEHAGHFINLLGSMFDRNDIRLEFKVQKVPRGLADAFVIGESFIDHDNVAMILGDNIFEDDFSHDIETFKKGGKVFAVKVPDPERSGVVKFDAQMKATAIVEKPKTWISDYAIPGMYIYDERVVEVAKQVKPSARGELEIVDLHNWYLQKGELEVGLLKGKWFDAGTFDSLLEASNYVQAKKLHEQFHPLVNDAIQRFNEELNMLVKKKF